MPESDAGSRMIPTQGMIVMSYPQPSRHHPHPQPCCPHNQYLPRSRSPAFLLLSSSCLENGWIQKMLGASVDSRMEACLHSLLEHMKQLVNALPPDRRTQAKTTLEASAVSSSFAPEGARDNEKPNPNRWDDVGKGGEIVAPPPE